MGFFDTAGYDLGNVDYGPTTISGDDLGGMWSGLDGYDTSGMGLWSGESLGDGGDFSALYGGTDGWSAPGALSAFGGMAPPPVAEAGAGYAQPSGAGGITSLAAQAEGAAPDATGSKNSLGGALTKLAGLKTGQDGSVEWLDPKNLDKMIKMGLGLAAMYGSKKNATDNAAAQSAATAAALQRQVQNQWTPQQQQWSNQFFQTARPAPQLQYASQQRSPIVASRGYAGGGAVAPEGSQATAGALSMLPMLFKELGFKDNASEEEQAEAMRQQQFMQMMEQMQRQGQAAPVQTAAPPQQQQGMRPSAPMAAPRNFAAGGSALDAIEGMGALSQSEPFVGYVEGVDGGQTDLIDAKLSPGEFVWDADTVSAIGDGNNAAGAEILEQERQRIRSAKRSAPPDQIPPTMAEINEAGAV